MEVQEFWLTPKTRSGASHQGKPNIYFTGYPSDIELYFDELSDDILKTQNCAVYRDRQPGLPRSREELERTIQEMQLLVIPVTGNFLDRESRARDEEFPIALQLHKPVLFWAQANLTPCQIKVFNDKCHKLQMLVKADLNPEPIPYGIKLANFLSENLVGDHLASRVRAEFEAYIFLSYRKKDREYVEPLMKAIHENDFCRDIAVWYDEFLTIGESFSSAIEDAMKKSSLVALLVTPSILEPGNYVKDNEYRDARRLLRPVVPVMAVETDPEALGREFHGLPSCIALDDASSLAQALRGGLAASGTAGDGCVSSPEHDYLIGLAYLNGIDVEVDSARGSALVISAAERGLEEAVERLVGMYHSGNGVPRDCGLAVQWQERLVELRRQAFQEAPTRDNGVQLAGAYYDLGNYCYELRDLPASKQAYQRMLETGEALTDALHMSSAAWLRLGDISQAEGSMQEAEEYFERCWRESWERSRQADIDGPMRYKLLLCTACCLERLGGIRVAQGDLAGARDFYQRGATIDRELVQARPCEETRQNLAVGYEKLGDVALMEGLLDQAEECFAQAVRLFQENVEEFQTEGASECLAAGLTKMGDVCLGKGELNRAKAYYLQGLSLRDRPEASAAAEGRGRLANSLSMVGLICLKLHELPQARACTERALELNRGLAEETGMLEALQALSINYSRLGDISEEEGNMDEAGRLYREDLRLSRQLVERAPTTANLRNLAVSFSRMGSFCAWTGEPEPAKQYHLQSAALYRQLADQLNVPELWHLLASEYCELGRISDGDERERYALQAYSIWRRLLRADPWNGTYWKHRDEVLTNLL